MSRRIGEVERISADINAVYKKVEKILDLNVVLARAAVELRGEPLPEMPDGLETRVAQVLWDCAAAAKRIVESVDEEIRLVDRRMKALWKATADGQQSNMSKATNWFDKFVEKHDKAFDTMFDMAPMMPGMETMRFVDGGSFVKGFGDATLGTVDLAQLLVRSNANDPEANTQLANMAETMERHPLDTLKGMVSYDKLVIAYGKGSTMQERKEALSEIGGGLSVDALIGLLTGGVGAGVTRGSQSLTAGRRAAVHAADLDLAKAQGTAAFTAHNAGVTAEALAQASRVRVAAAGDIDLGSVVGDMVRGLSGRPTKLGDLWRASERESAAQRAAADAGSAHTRAEALTVEQVVFRDSVAQKLKPLNVEFIGIRAAADRVNTITGIVPTDLRAVAERLVEAVRQGLQEAAQRPTPPSAMSDPTRRTTP